MSAARSVAEAVRARAGCAPDRELVRLVGQDGWSAEQLCVHAERIARGLARVVRPRDAVLTAVDPGPETIALTTALSMLGAVEVAYGEGMDRAAAPRLAQATGSVLAIADPARLSTDPSLSALAELCPLGLVLTGQTEGAWHGATLGDLAAEPGALPDHEPSLADPALVLPTSGTTGRPKAAALPNGAGLAQAARVQRAMGYSADDVIFNFFSWQHVNARHAAFLPALISGGRLVVARRFSASTFWATAQAEDVTAFNFMGAVCVMLLRQPRAALDRAHAITRAYGGPAPAWLTQAMAARFGVQLRQAYACTELGDVATTGNLVRPGAAGRPVPEYDVDVRDSSGRSLPEGSAGELVVRPRGENLTFTGYVDDPEATALAWRGGWFHTGDRVRLDDGWLFFEGRSAEVIRRRGLNISAAAVEHAVAELEGVAEVVAVGVASELTEEEVHVIVVPLKTASLDPATIHRHCREVLPAHALPRFISMETSLPRNANMKILRGRLRDRGLLSSTWDAEQDLRTAPATPQHE